MSGGTFVTRRRLSHVHHLMQYAIEPLEIRRLLATVTVTGTGDTSGVDASVTLREAIASINQGSNVNSDVVAVGAYGTSDTINFNIAGGGVHTISPTAALPTIVKPVTIDGYSQTGASVNTLANSDDAVLLIQLSGTSAGSGTDGLTLGAGSDGSTIRGMVVNNFAGDGIVAQSNGNSISGNFIGVDPAGTTRMPNGNFPISGDGVQILNASSNTIGGTTPCRPECHLRERGGRSAYYRHACFAGDEQFGRGKLRRRRRRRQEQRGESNGARARSGYRRGQQSFRHRDFRRK